MENANRPGVDYAYRGLSVEQRIKVKAILSKEAPVADGRRARRGDRPRQGWSIFRSPTTIHPPTTLRLHYRDANGKLVKVTSITEPGDLNNRAD